MMGLLLWLDLSRGVATRLKKDNPNIIAIHCIKYRLALGVSQAAKSEPNLKKFGEILVTILIIYSAVRQARLEEIQDIMQTTKCY